MIHYGIQTTLMTQGYPSKQGIKAFIPQIKTPNKTIHNGYDEAFWELSKSAKKPFSLITVSGNLHLNFQAELKGIDLIIEAAKQFPSFEFAIIGVSENHQLKNVPNNVQLIGPSKAEELKTYYSTHEYYIQLSIAEGFPNSLCEAMLCGCTPIVSNVFSMGKIVKNAGFIIHQRELSRLIEVLNDIQKSHKLDSELSRKNISNYYSINNRKDQLLELVSKLTN